MHQTTQNIKALFDAAKKASQKALARETGALRADIDPMDVGGAVSKELRAGEQAARDLAGEKFADVPDQIQVVDDLLDEFKKIMKPTHTDEGAKRFPGILSRKIKRWEEAAKEGEPTTTLKDIQGLRSEILDDLRMAKEHKKPRQLRKRLSDAAEVIDKKLSGEIQKVPVIKSKAVKSTESGNVYKSDDYEGAYEKLHKAESPFPEPRK